MSLFSLIAALLLEQLHPLASRKCLYTWLNGYVHFFQHHFNAGDAQAWQDMAWFAITMLLGLGPAGAVPPSVVHECTLGQAG